MVVWNSELYYNYQIPCLYTWLNHNSCLDFADCSTNRACVRGVRNWVHEFPASLQTTTATRKPSSSSSLDKLLRTSPQQTMCQCGCLTSLHWKFQQWIYSWESTRSFQRRAPVYKSSQKLGERVSIQCTSAGYCNMQANWSPVRALVWKQLQRIVQYVAASISILLTEIFVAVMGMSSKHKRSTFWTNNVVDKSKPPV